MLSTLSAVEKAGEKRGCSDADNFNLDLPEACGTENEVLHGFCALIKPSANNKEAPRYSSSESNEGSKAHFNISDENKDKAEQGVRIYAKDYGETKESEGNVCLPDLCNQFEEMSKVSCFPSQPSLPTPQHLVSLKDSKSPAALALATNSENLFDEPFDLDDFMFPQNSATVSIPHQLPSGSEISFNSSSDPDQQKTENFTATQLLTTNTELSGYCETNFTPLQDSSRTVSSSDLGILCNAHQSSYNLCNNAFMENFESSRKSAYYSIPTSTDHNNTNSSFNLKQEYESYSTSTIPQNDFSNLHTSHFITSFEQRFEPANTYTDIKPRYILGPWQNGNPPQILSVVGGEGDNEEMGRLSNLSSDSRTGSNDTDIRDPDESLTEPVINSKTGYLENRVNPSSKKTAYNEKWGVKVFKAWCSDQQISDGFEKLTAEDLNELLIRFWKSIRKSNGDYYGRNSLFNLRAMINKHLKGEPHLASFDIVTDDRFRTSNECLDDQLKHLKGIGRTIAHKVPISPSDIKLLYESKVLSTSSPISLLRKVWFEITLHFCPKGGEAQEKIKKTTFKIFRDDTGRRYVARSAVISHDDGKTEARMYDTFGSLCPVKSFEFYVSKLHPLQARLFQQPRKKTNATSMTWYGKSPIGEKALQQMMAIISKEAKLSKRYTNHCVRTTALQQFTELRKNYEALEPPGIEPGMSTNSIQENSDLGTAQLGSIGEPILPQSSFREVSEGMTSSMNLYNSTNCGPASPNPCLMPYASPTETLHRRQCVSAAPVNNFVPVLENSDVNLSKRSYFSEVPLFPPPPYSEHSLRLHSLPSKRPRREEAFYQLRPQSVPIDLPITSHQNTQLVFENPHSYSYSSYHFGPQPLSNGDTFKESPVLSPIQVSNSSQSKKRSRKLPLKKNNKLSQAIVTGFPFEFSEPSIDYEKSCIESQAQA